jgi:hypothetical protein
MGQHRTLTSRVKNTAHETKAVLWISHVRECDHMHVHSEAVDVAEGRQLYVHITDNVNNV